MLKLTVSLNFLILSQSLVNGPQTLLVVNLGCLKYNSSKNLSPVNKDLLSSNSF